MKNNLLLFGLTIFHLFSSITNGDVPIITNSLANEEGIDLFVENIEVEPILPLVEGHINPLSGQAFSIYATIKNSGSLNASKFWVSVFIDGVYFGDKDLALGLNSQQSYRKKIVDILPGTIGHGSHAIEVKVDLSLESTHNMQITELNEDNNILTLYQTIDHRFFLYPTSSPYVISPVSGSCTIGYQHKIKIAIGTEMARHDISPELSEFGIIQISITDTNGILLDTPDIIGQNLYYGEIGGGDGFGYLPNYIEREYFLQSSETGDKTYILKAQFRPNTHSGPINSISYIDDTIEIPFSISWVSTDQSQPKRFINESTFWNKGAVETEHGLLEDSGKLRLGNGGAAVTIGAFTSFSDNPTVGEKRKYRMILGGGDGDVIYPHIPISSDENASWAYESESGTEYHFPQYLGINFHSGGIGQVLLQFDPDSVDIKIDSVYAIEGKTNARQGFNLGMDIAQVLLPLPVSQYLKIVTDLITDFLQNIVSNILFWNTNQKVYIEAENVGGFENIKYWHIYLGGDADDALAIAGSIVIDYEVEYKKSGESYLYIIPDLYYLTEVHAIPTNMITSSFKYPIVNQYRRQIIINSSVASTIGNEAEINIWQNSTQIYINDTFNYGSSSINLNNDREFLIENAGNNPLSILNLPINILGINSNQYSIISQPSETIAPGESSSFTVRFLPTSAGEKTAYISIGNNDSNENPYIINFSGTGIGTQSASLQVTANPSSVQTNNCTIITATLIDGNSTPIQGKTLTFSTTFPPGIFSGAAPVGCSGPTYEPGNSGVTDANGQVKKYFKPTSYGTAVIEVNAETGESANTSISVTQIPGEVSAGLYVYSSVSGTYSIEGSVSIGGAVPAMNSDVRLTTTVGTFSPNGLSYYYDYTDGNGDLAGNYNDRYLLTGGYSGYVTVTLEYIPTGYTTSTTFYAPSYTTGSNLSYAKIKTLSTANRVYTVNWAKDGSKLFAGTYTDKYLYGWDTSSWNQVFLKTDLNHYALTSAVDPTNTKIAVGENGGGIEIYYFDGTQIGGERDNSRDIRGLDWVGGSLIALAETGTSSPYPPKLYEVTEAGNYYLIRDFSSNSMAPKSRLHYRSSKNIFTYLTQTLVGSVYKTILHIHSGSAPYSTLRDMLLYEPTGYDIDITPDGGKIGVVGGARGAMIIDTTGWSVFQIVDWTIYDHICFLGNSGNVALGDEQTGIVRIYDQSGKIVKEINEGANVDSMAYTPSLGLLAIGLGDGRVVIYGSDSLAPQVNNVIINPDIYSIGTVFDISAKFTDELSGIDDQSAKAYVRNAEENIIATIDLVRGSGDTFSGQWNSSGISPEIYHIGIFVEDNAGNQTEQTAVRYLDFTTPPIYYSLYIQSSPDSGVPLSVSPFDKNGNGDGSTFFIRSFPENGIVTLTAPSEFNNAPFVKWEIDETEIFTNTTQFTMDSDKIATAYYLSITNLNSPTLSSPANGATIQNSSTSLVWNDTNSNPQENGYKIRIKAAEGQYSEYNVAQSITSYPLADLNNGTTYYWNLMAIGNGTTTSDSIWANSGVDWSFTVASSGTPSITSIVPSEGNVGVPVTINGSNFGATQGTVTFNGTTAVINSWSTTQIQTAVPTGATTGSIVVHTSDAQDSNAVSFTVTGTNVPEINIKQNTTSIPTGGAFDIGTQQIGNSTSVTFTVENLGNADLLLSGTPKVSLSGANADQFSITQQPSSPIVSSGTTNFIIAFNPTSAGEKNAILSITNNDGDENPYVISMTGTGSSAVMYIFGFNEGSGTLFSDDNANGISGTLFNEPQWVSSEIRDYNGNPGYGILYDGIDDYSNLSAQPINDGPFTIMLWARKNSGDGGDLVRTNNPGSQDGYLIYQQSDGKITAFICTSNGQVYLSSDPLSDHEWFHIALVYDQTMLKLYIDGVLAQEVPQTGALVTPGYIFTIGGRWNYYSGEIDGLKISHDAFSIQQIQETYNAEKPGTESSSITITLTPAEAVTAGARWRVDGGAWQNSGATVSGLTPGGHPVEYLAVAGWAAPANESVTIASGVTTSISRAYAPLNGPGWVPITNTQYNMIVRGGKVYNSGTLAKQGDWLGAFGPGGEQDCRAVAQVAAEGSYYLTVVGNTNSENITFKLWPLPNGTTTSPSQETLLFVSDNTYLNQDLHFGIETQTLQLNAAGEGWNWISFNVLPSDTSLAAVFEAYPGISQIKAQSQSALKSGTAFIGDLLDMSGINNGLMYKIKTSQNYNLTVSGQRINKPLSLSAAGAGWNWKAFLPVTPPAMPIETALASIIGHLQQVKAQSQSAINTGGSLVGDLTQMESGKGYMMKVGADCTLIYPAASGTFTSAETISDPPAWTQITGTQYNMIATGNLHKNGETISESGYWLGSFGPGGLADCRSVSEVSSTGSYYATIVGNANGETIRFLVYESATSRVYEVTETVVFTSDELKTNIGLHFETMPPIINLSKTSLNYVSEQNGTPTSAETVIVTNAGTGTLNWTATTSTDWISVLPVSGTGSGVLTIGIARTDMAPGSYTGTIAIIDPNATNSPQSINVALNVLPEGADSPPFGYFETPIDGVTVASSVPVTGWVLDDIGVESVKIYRGTGIEDRVEIGKATLVKGARPDVEAAFPSHPQNDRAGWGYMMLTNFLPNGGNGAFQILAYATDTGGNEVFLGGKTIICDNLNAVKPFGAIDTPAQGGLLVGPNFGWALTPQPKSIPVDGSTITVWVDGLPLGHPVYNNYRWDIATLFPSYANSNGAVGYYYLDTTSYENGVHSIAWSVMDSAGAMDGIGSRYFTIQNVAGGAGRIGMGDSGVISAQGVRAVEEIAGIPLDRRTPVYVARGYRIDQPAEMAFPGADGTIHIEIPEISRIAIYLSEKETNEGDGRVIGREKQRPGISRAGSRDETRFNAYELVLDELRPLPIGSSFDADRGIFYWQPGPGFLGEYEFLFLQNEAGRNSLRKTIKISIIPREYH